MNVESIREYCLSKDDVEEAMPFGEGTIVFKTGGKIFLLMGLDSVDLSFNVKCDPAHALELREQYACVLPGFHMNKKHWNTVNVDGTLTAKQLKEMIDESYTLVKPKAKKNKA